MNFQGSINEIVFLFSPEEEHGEDMSLLSHDYGRRSSTTLASRKAAQDAAVYFDGRSESKDTLHDYAVVTVVTVLRGSHGSHGTTR